MNFELHAGLPVVVDRAGNVLDFADFMDGNYSQDCKTRMLAEYRGVMGRDWQPTCGALGYSWD